MCPELNYENRPFITDSNRQTAKRTTVLNHAFLFEFIQFLNGYGIVFKTSKRRTTSIR